MQSSKTWSSKARTHTASPFPSNIKRQSRIKGVDYQLLPTCNTTKSSSLLTPFIKSGSHQTSKLARISEILQMTITMAQKRAIKRKLRQLYENSSWITVLSAWSLHLLPSGQRTRKGCKILQHEVAKLSFKLWVPSTTLTSTIII